MIRRLSLSGYLAIIMIGINLCNANPCEPITCEFVEEGSLVRNRTKELECCNITVEQYYCNWDRGSHYLSTFLNTLKTWKCPEFEEQCTKQTFAYTDFTELLYLTFCNRTSMEEQCRNDIVEEVERQSGDNGTMSSSSWTELAQSLNLTKISDEDLLKPCIQVSMLVANSPASERFQEIINPLTPLCSSFVWCGFDQDVITSRPISIWTCMPSECHVNIIVIGVFCGLLALATTIGNVIVLAVLGFNKNLMNGITVYKISIAAADFLVGVLIFPTFISTIVKFLLQPRILGEQSNITTYVPASNGSALTQLFFPDVHDNTGGLFYDRVSQMYLNAVGFFTTLSLCVSLYSLAAAAVDRYVAVRHPLKYRHSASALAARKVVIAIWLVAILFSSVPFFVDNLRYRIINAIFVSSGGSAALILYLFAFFFPLITMWGVSLATYCAFRIHNRKTSLMMSSDSNLKKTTILEMRLARTLGIMVGVFTLCLLPVAIVLVLTFFLPGILIFDPESLTEKALSDFSTVEIVVIIILTTNSLWNFFIYSARDVRFWDATKELLTTHLPSSWQRHGRASTSGSHLKTSAPKRSSTEPSASASATSKSYKKTPSMV